MSRIDGRLSPLGPDDSTTDAEKNAVLKNAIDVAIDNDPTRFTTRSFVMLWNEGHSIRLINRDDPRKAISIPWDEIEALRALLTGTHPVATTPTEGGVDGPTHRCNGVNGAERHGTQNKCTVCGEYRNGWFDSSGMEVLAPTKGGERRDVWDQLNKRRHELIEIKRGQGGLFNERDEADFNALRYVAGMVRGFFDGMPFEVNDNSPEGGERCAECRHKRKFFYLLPESGDKEPRCWHEDEDGYCGHRCDSTAPSEGRFDINHPLSCARWVPYDEHHRRYDGSIQCSCAPTVAAPGEPDVYDAVAELREQCSIDTVIAGDPALKEAFDIQRPKSYQPSTTTPSERARAAAREILATVVGFNNLDDLAALSPESGNRKHVEAEIVAIISGYFPAETPPVDAPNESRHGSQLEEELREAKDQTCFP